MKELFDITITDRIENLLKAMNKNLFGKEEAIRLALLCAVAGESCFLMGPPGTAKSMISRRVQKVFKGDTTYFEYLMNEFTTPDEICGPVSLKNLENDVYKRMTTGFLPEANIAFLDEIWKSGPAILNTLLTIINEKIYHNGNEKINVPLKALIAASNEFPTKGRGLEALWDRFVVRVKVDGVKSKSDFFKLVDGDSDDIEIPEALKISLDDLETWKNEINKVTLNESAKDIILSTRKMMDEKNKENEREDDEKYYVSDRRWKKIVHLLKTSAFLNGRTEVLKTDCGLIQYCIWGTEKQHDEVKREMNSILNISGWAKESIRKIAAESTLNELGAKVNEYELLVNSSNMDSKLEFKTTIYGGKQYYVCTREPLERWSHDFIDYRNWFFPVYFNYFDPKLVDISNYIDSSFVDDLRMDLFNAPENSAVVYVSTKNYIDKDAEKKTLKQDSDYQNGGGAVLAKTEHQYNSAFGNYVDKENIILIGKRRYKYSKFVLQSKTKTETSNEKKDEIYNFCKDNLEKLVQTEVSQPFAKNLFVESTENLPLDQQKKKAAEFLQRLESAHNQYQRLQDSKVELNLWKN